MSWKWLENFVKGIAKRWLTKNKTNIVEVFDSLTDEVGASAKTEFFKKYPNMPADVKDAVNAFITMFEDEADKTFEKELDKIIGRLLDGPPVTTAPPETKV
jgi:NADH/NAD ratio-sensing transcriptional regulator Rex